MSKKEFKIGDRVRCIEDCLNYVLKNEEGVVIDLMSEDTLVAVKWDNYSEYRHGLGGLVQNGYGYLVNTSEIEKINEDISNEAKDLITDIINNVKAVNGEFLTVEEVIKVGDRVRCVHSDNFSVLVAGEQGTVVVIEKPEPAIGVKWDDYHEEKCDLFGNCEDGYGFWVSKNSVKKIENSGESGELKIDTVEDKSIAEEIVDDFERMVQRISYTKTEDVNKNQVLSPKEILKAGMVVEIANGDIGLFDGKRIVCLDDFYDLDDFNDDLQEVEGDEEFLIIAIYKPNCPYNLKNINKRVDKFEVVWKKEGFKRDVKKEFSKDELTILENLYLDGHKYLARDECGSLWAYSDIPEKEVSSWSCHFCDNMFLGYVSKLFKYISWEDEKPTKISDYI